VIDYSWCGSFTNAELNALHAEGFGHRLLDDDWQGQVSRHSLGWVCAREDGELAGFVGRRHVADASPEAAGAPGAVTCGLNFQAWCVFLIGEAGLARAGRQPGMAASIAAWRSRVAQGAKWLPPG
jgi:hypothetical protein